MNIEIDNFNKDRFMSYVDNVFIKILHSIMLNKIETVNHFVSDSVYNILKKRVDELENMNYIKMYDMTNVKESNITNYIETKDKYIIEVTLCSRYVEYIMDKNTNEIISGDDEYRIEKTNILTFERNKNVKKSSIAKKCPTCGASIDVNNNGKCTYCGSIYDLENYDFILINWEELEA